MDTWADQPSEHAPGLREFLAEPARDEAWNLPAGAEALAECDLYVEEPQLSGSGSRSVKEGGVRLNRVTYRPLSPDDAPAIAGYRAGLENVQLVLAMFWFMLTELPARRRYDSIRIRIKLRPPAPVLLLSPDLPDGAGQAWQVLAAEIASAVASLLRTGTQLAATGVDLGDDGFGWTYQARDDEPLIPQRLTTLAILELPPDAAGLIGVLDAEAQISRFVLRNVIPRKAAPVNTAIPFLVPFEENRGERRAQPGGYGGQRQSSADEHRDRACEGSPQLASYDLGLIVPLRKEFDCAREIFTFGEQICERGTYIYPFSVPGSRLRGVAVVLYDMGPTASGVTAANLLGRFEIPVLALMGIAGALDGDLRLGDVVVASLVDQYFNRAKARPDATGEGFEFDSGGSVWRAGRDIVSFAHNFRYRADPRDECAGWRSRSRDRREAAGLPWDGALARAEPEYAVAPVASGEIVGASAGFARWLREHHRQCAAIEMEAGGVAQAVYEHGGADMLIVRGISDFADERKPTLDATAAAGADHGAWRRYAALNAADLLATMLCSPGFPGRPGTA
jgi:nucleoside phosphorylase